MTKRGLCSSTVVGPRLDKEESLDGEARIALNDFHRKLRGLTLFPERRAELSAIEDGPAIGCLGSLDRTWNADELSLQIVAGGVNDCVPVAAHIDEGKM